MKTEVSAKLIFGAIYSELLILEQAITHLAEQHWSVQRESPEYSFDKTDYYAPEMGSCLKRRFYSLEGIYSLESATDWKLRMQKIENHLSHNGKRKINLDPGYLDLQRVVLLSAKEGPQKIYLGKKVWADLVLLKAKGGYQNLAWTFPDLRDGRYNDFFLAVRSDFKTEKLLSPKKL
ncbi:MAG: DUF4416 family protein [SAR324 cluster bacterium]|nr:DUF4416 family protein [SAR324 cluster bacterium]MBL7034314.1 DUF4416 family protein [SAR324 cluster bacterium]